MAAIHYRPPRTAAERDLDGAIRRAEARCREMEARLDLLESHIVETRRLADAAGIFDPRTTFAEPRERRARAPERKARLAFRTALARAVLKP